MRELPYFDLLLEGRNSPPLGPFVHVGYWDEAPAAPPGAADLMRAMERLNERVLDAARLADGLSVVDAGCGFGGTLAAVDARHRDMTLTGVNVDPRQLAIAARQQARDGSTLRWLEADACALPLPDASADRVIALECVFHFSSRAAFLRECARVLRPGGMLVLTDWVPSRLLPARWFSRRMADGFGTMGEGSGVAYAALARDCGLRVAEDLDITAQTSPTYALMLGWLERGAGQDARGRLFRATRWLDRLCRWGLVRYRLLVFRSPA